MKKTIVAVALFLPLVLFAQDKKGVEPTKELRQDEAVKEEVQSMDIPVMKMHGYVVDAMCAKGMMKNSETTMKKAMAHTKECALEDQCASSGFGLMSDGKWYKFDEKGDALAKESIANSKSEKALMYEVTGTMDGDRILVASLGEKMPEKKMEKKSEAKEEHKH